MESPLTNMNMGNAAPVETLQAIEHFVRKLMFAEQPVDNKFLHYDELLTAIHRYADNTQNATSFLENCGCIPVDGGGWLMPAGEEIQPGIEFPTHVPMENI